MVVNITNVVERCWPKRFWFSFIKISSKFSHVIEARNRFSKNARYVLESPTQEREIYLRSGRKEGTLALIDIYGITQDDAKLIPIVIIGKISAIDYYLVHPRIFLKHVVEMIPDRNTQPAIVKISIDQTHPDLPKFINPDHLKNISANHTFVEIRD